VVYISIFYFIASDNHNVCDVSMIYCLVGKGRPFTRITSFLQYIFVVCLVKNATRFSSQILTQTLSGIFLLEYYVVDIMRVQRSQCLCTLTYFFVMFCSNLFVKLIFLTSSTIYFSLLLSGKVLLYQILCALRWRIVKLL
jgi:hypothetical protein